MALKINSEALTFHAFQNSRKSHPFYLRCFEPTSRKTCWLVILAFLCYSESALSIEGNPFLNIDSIIIKPRQAIEVKKYAINVLSYSKPIRKSSIRYLDKLDKTLVYSARISLKNKVYYRLVSGNYKTLKEANEAFTRLKKYYPDAWINDRTDQERKGLIQILSLTEDTLTPTKLPAVKSPVVKLQPIRIPQISKPAARQPATSSSLSAAENPPPPSLLEQAKQEFLFGNYLRVLAITDKIMAQGDSEETQAALELNGIVSERQNNFDQAIAIYTSFLELYPDSKLSNRVSDRLNGLETMSLETRENFATNKLRPKSDWSFDGSVSQFYQDETIVRDNLDEDIVNSSWITDVDLYARRITDTDTLIMQFDGGLVNNIEADDSDSRVSRAMISYINGLSNFKITGGRQSNTAKGQYGRFDGLVFDRLSKSYFNYSISIGYPVQSSYDGIDSERQFVGTSLNFHPTKEIEMDVYLLNQNVSNLVDRRVIGTEVQYRSDDRFLYGLIDYDIHFSDLNNATAIGNYRYNNSLSLNMTYSYRNSPLLSTTNALQGQAVGNIAALEEIFSTEEIYQLAEDRTSKSQNLFFGSSYEIDSRRQMYLSMALSSTEATGASGGVLAIPASDGTHLSAEYTVQEFFTRGDYSSIGTRLSFTTSSDVISLRARTRLPGPGNMRYDPRIRLDYRKNLSTDVNQWIINPSIKMSYKLAKKMRFEGSLSIEVSDYKLPELDDQTAYFIYLGYLYQF